MSPCSLLRKPGTAVSLPVVQKAMIQAGGMGLSFPWECDWQPFCSSQHPCQLGRGACSLPSLPSSTTTSLLLSSISSFHSPSTVKYSPKYYKMLLSLSPCTFPSCHQLQGSLPDCFKISLTFPLFLKAGVTALPGTQAGSLKVMAKSKINLWLKNCTDLRFKVIIYFCLPASFLPLSVSVTNTKLKQV